MSDIDITDLVDALKNGFISWAVNALFAWTVSFPFLSWLGLPVVSSIYRLILNALMSALANFAEMQGFFLNTALKKSGQAKDFVDAVKFRQSLPPNVTEEAYAKAEKRQMDAFSALVRVA